MVLKLVSIILPRKKKTHSSWCGLQRDVANKTSLFHSKKGLPPAIVEIIEPIYEALSEESLLSQCLDSYMQNPNESLNNLIWKRCPKKIYQGKKIAELCTASAVTQFNDGASSIAAVLKRMGIIPGKNTGAAVLKTDKKRLAIAEEKSSERVKKKEGKGSEP